MKQFLILFLLIFTNSHASTIYVNAGATGSNNGLSWNNAYTNLQEALSNAIFGDEIWVASGTYKTTTTDNRSISFVMKNGVNVYGGFNATELSISERDIQANPTTLSGDIGQLGEDSDNTNNLVRINNVTSSITLDGFRIISGKAATGCGGLLLSNNTGTVNVSNCLFFNNSGNSAGAIFIGNQGNYTVNVSRCEFISNVSINGIIHFDESSLNNLNISESEFKSSVTGGVSVLRFFGSDLTMDRCMVTNNTSNQSNLIYIDANSSAIISNSLFVGNSYKESAIAFYSSSGISQILENVTVAHNKKTFLTNTFYTTVYSVNGTAEIYNSLIYGNTNSSNDDQIDAGNIVANSIVENGYTSGTSVLNIDPLFINPNSLDSAPFDNTNFDYNLQNDSEAINFGNNTYVTKSLDLNGSTRIVQSIVDAGAFENNSILGLNEYTYDKSNLFYDYPSNTIRLQNIEFGKISIFDISGKHYQTHKIREQHTLFGLNPGIYFIILHETDEKLKILVK